MGKIKFNSDWLSKTDCDGLTISNWCSYMDNKYLYCNVCCKKFNYALKGFHGIQQHAGYMNHKKNSNMKLNANQLHLELNTQENMINDQQNQITMYSNKEATRKAELIWSMRTVASNWSAASCDQNAKDFKTMFPGSISETFCLGRTKLSYLLTEALGPYFKNEMLAQIKGEYFSLIYDETTNTEGKKELQTAVRFWSNKKGQIVVHNLETFFIGHATGEIIVDCLNQALDNGNIDLSKLLMLGSDGPNVNKKVFRLVNEQVKAIREKGLYNLGTCNIHIVHNAFLKGIKVLGEDSSELIRGIHHFFDDRPTRREDFEKIQMKLDIDCNNFIKHVPTRWLTIEAAVKRVLQQWTALIEYFLKFIPAKLPHLKHASGYSTIVRILEKSTILAELHFLGSVTKIFLAITHIFQQEAPLIHVLHTELKKLVQTLLSRYMNDSMVLKFNNNSAADILSDIVEEKNMVPLKFMECGNNVRDNFKNVSTSDQDHFLRQVRKFYIESVKHLIMKTPINSQSPSYILKYCRCLNPMQIANTRSRRDIIKLSQILPFDVPSDTLYDEWNALELEKIPDKLINGRVDIFWNYIFQLRSSSDIIKYPNIQKTVKCFLSLSHGSADVERGFSRSSRFLPEDRAAMSVKVLNARLNVADGLQEYQNVPTAVPITKSLLSYAYSACSKYKIYLEEEAKLKEAEKKKLNREQEEKEERERIERELVKNKESLSELEGGLNELKKDLLKKQNQTDTHLTEASNLLRNAINKGNIEEAVLAQTILEGAVQKRTEETDYYKQLKTLQTRVDKRKSSLITYFFPKKAKK